MHKNYSPQKEVLLFLMIWPISALSLSILIMSTSFFYHFITEIKEFLAVPVRGFEGIIHVFLFFPYVIYKFVESIFFVMETTVQAGIGYNLKSTSLWKTNKFFIYKFFHSIIHNYGKPTYPNIIRQKIFSSNFMI